MAQYITCPQKSNRPRMNVAVCLAKCGRCRDCPEVRPFLESPQAGDCVPVPADQS